MRIISPPRHGGKASVWRDRSAIPRAARRLFRFGNVGSFCQTPPGRRGANRSPALARTPHCCSLIFIVICASGDAGRNAQSRAAQGEIRASVQRPHCFSLLLTMPRCGSAAPDTRAAPHGVRHRAAARCLSGKMLVSILARFGASSSRCQTARSRACAMRLPCALARNRRPSGSSPEDHFECESLLP
jgi:hypothetical protein